jgi:predicted N-acetyltransferase YhbS
MKAYGGRCSCCQEWRLAFLTIDVVIPDPEFHKKIGYGPAFYRYLRKNGYPQENFVCLCINCNFAKGLFGACPHQKEILNETLYEEEINAW